MYQHALQENVFFLNLENLCSLKLMEILKLEKK